MYQPSQLGANIRHFRKVRGLTQAALAKALFLTPQNISKWENGQSVPDVENLCRVADALDVGVERLLGNAPSTHGKLMVGIDGGGTKTEFCLFDERGCVLARERLGGTNPNVYGVEGAISTLKKGIDAVTVRENGISAIFAGIAGCGVESNRRAVISALMVDPFLLLMVYAFLMKVKPLTSLPPSDVVKPSPTLVKVSTTVL
jgi:transcriptional regulator with XRE-family HTH domain